MSAKFYALQSRRKRRKVARTNVARSTKFKTAADCGTPGDTKLEETIHSAMKELIAGIPDGDASDDYSFEDFIDTILPELVDAAAMAQVERLQYDDIVGSRDSHLMTFD